MDYLLSAVLLTLLFAAGIQCEECLKVPKTAIQCFDDDAKITTINLQCPDTHRIYIKKEGAEYLIASQNNCPTAPLDQGLATRVEYIDNIVDQCSGSSCSYAVTKDDSPITKALYPRYTGRHYLQVEYRCIPDQDVSQSISICDDKTLVGNMVTIRSYSDPANMTYINSTNCACRIYTKANTQVEFRRLQFETSPNSQSLKCDQRVVLWRIQGDLNRICPPGSAFGGEPVFGCYDYDDLINLSFDNRDQVYSAAFAVEASAPENQVLTIQCGMDASNMNWTTTTTKKTYQRLSTTTRLPTTTRTTQAPEPAGQSKSKSKNTQIIAGVAAALVAIIIIIVIVIIVRKKKSKQEKAKNALPPNTFYATISKGSGNGTFVVGDKATWPRIRPMPDTEEDNSYYHF